MQGYVVTGFRIIPDLIWDRDEKIIEIINYFLKKSQTIR